MAQHRMKLQPKPFAQVKAGTKTIELRLNDDKRQTMQAGDEIIFTLEPENIETLTTVIVERLVYPSFAALVTDFPPESMGFEGPVEAADARPEYYSAEHEQRYGALGLRIMVRG